KSLGKVRSVFLVEERTERALVDALKRGRLYAVEQEGGAELVLAEFSVRTGASAGVSGDVLRAPEAAQVEITVAVESTGPATREGPRWLTVPVNARLGTAIHAVTVDTSQPWRARHFTLIENNYGAAPAWRQYRDELHAFYGREWDRLAPTAVASAEWLAGKLGVTTPTRLASEVSLPDVAPGDATARLVGLSCALRSYTYLP